nr:PREDICTED: homeobox protein NANOG-like [Lepisosteus oculatus]
MSPLFGADSVESGAPPWPPGELDSWSSPSADESYALRPPPAPCSPAETACAEPVPAPCSWAKGAEEQGQQQGALLDMDPGAAPAAGKRARKLRTAFSETQMTALCERYMIKMYLTPAEMKSLADKIGLSYKQVKTWFQNRRMKQKRQQKTLTEGEEQVPSSGYPIIQPLLLESSSSAYPNIPPLALVSTSSAYTNIQAQTSESSAYPNAQAEASESSPYPSIQTQSFEDLGSVYPNFQAQTLESPTSVHASVSPQTSESPTAVYPNVSPQTSKSSSSVYPNISLQFSVNPNCPYPNIPLVTSEIPSSLYNNVSPNILEGPSSAYPNIPPQLSFRFPASRPADPRADLPTLLP